MDAAAGERGTAARGIVMTTKCAMLAVALAFLVPAGAGATGTIRIQQPDGNVKYYTNVRIAVVKRQMTITSADGVGSIVVQRAGCEVVGKLLRCSPYDAVLKQRGGTVPIAIAHGTAWLNPGTETQTLPMSSTRLPHYGVIVSARSERGTYLSLTGVADVVQR